MDNPAVRSAMNKLTNVNKMSVENSPGHSHLEHSPQTIHPRRFPIRKQGKHGS